LKKEWLELVACVVLYKYKDKKEEFSDYEFLLIKRNDCKWAIPGGVGASEITDNLFNFAAFEVSYDTNFHISISQLEQFKTIISDCGKKITVFFSYNIGKYTTIHEDELRGELFTLKQIIGMEKSDKIAFNNAEIIKEFILCRR
jgi:hypothetical protein